MHDLFDLYGGGCGCGCAAADADTDVPTMPLIGDPAPEFKAMTTNGPINFPADYAGKWVVLFSHPSDFTPVCTSEFMALAALQSELAELNTELVGLSVGSVSSHLAWIDAIREIKWRGWEDIEITFPVIDDIGMHVARLYGMIHPNASVTHAVRAVFIIDPQGIVRAIMYYPASTGRSMDEILRTVIALQTADAFKCATPADWTPGDQVLISAPTTSDTMRDAKQTMASPRRNQDVRAWFFTLKELPAKDVHTKLRKAKKPATAAATKPKNKTQKRK